MIIMLKPSRVSGSSSKLGKRRGFTLRISLKVIPQLSSTSFGRNHWSVMGNPPDEYWEKSYKIQYEKLFEPYIIMVSADVPLYDERFSGVVSHLATVAAHTGEQFFVLPGVFLLASAHERSESWSNRYSTRSDDETKFNQLVLKGLYYNFMKNLEDGNGPIVSENTKSKERLLLLQERESKRKDAESKSTQTDTVLYPTKSLLCY
ncbi:hypothetical protein FRACYDRAFT_267442 [Fragilariopsis cylindrus CCMP1102]|uniref:Uncharacterized protein n=1 Tax=Fragilariopsis cylindrus CCMP1102 TaxID=635003 RepID=A0A1E7FXY1_9STRA|nr:hypothetical protein FRACYDRAFT_267442 [Fragilariopsis cylindrus CCMP1102]|eukprot:OEU23007.1 hypothetical protein FRACYDRAFT_267442 [Fragilariopsis cylindrus CCMP1102]